MVEAILINGLVLGGMYAVLAVGFALVFGVAKILNMAHTAFYMVGAYLILIMSIMLGFPSLPSIVLAIAIMGITGRVIYKLFLDRVKEHPVAVMIISVGVAILFQEVLLIGFGGHFRGIDPFIHGFVEIGGIRAAYQQVIAIVTSLLALVAIRLLLSKTQVGNAIRAVAEDREIANVMGIDVSRICVITMGISAVLAAVAGAVVAPVFMVHPLMWMHPLTIVLAAVVLGGLGSIKGSILGAFILGFAETAVIFLVPMGAFLRGAVGLSVMVVVLLLRPEGLFGVVFEEERL
ncbi:branched-chain amino acid ABC transporter permease [Dehalococcoidia bacterium]|nr:branched-chain amino acid ABC transporter permease [Dehalococcoidia bacterium]MCL0097018.1 branched-chain amino acid ABC transporter permease [Dehalococcoidia bacterium]